jgi:molybdenum cofactor cytidylyltransferase
LLTAQWDRPSHSVACHSSLENDSRGAAELLRVPRYRGRRGHPIWFSRELIPEFLDLPAGGAARDVVRRHAEDTAFLDLDDPGILADIDDRADYAALRGEAS